MAVLVVDNIHSTISTACLDALARQGTCVIFCGENRLPTGILQPLAATSRRLPILQLQMSQAKPKLNRLWQQIIKQKISNQARCLELLGKKSDLASLVDAVKSGDRDNRESIAAAKYFKLLFAEPIIRNDDNLANALLNYGYAVIRAYIARMIASYGLEPSVGIFHHSELNSFNLADDLIEPFRPVVDLQAVSLAETEEKKLTPLLKQKMLEVLSHDVLLGKERHPVSYAVERCVQSLLRSYEGKKSVLVLPALLPRKIHLYE